MNDASSNANDPVAPVAPALGISMSTELGVGRNLVLQTHVSSDCAPADLKQLLDKLATASDQQRERYDAQLRLTALKELEEQQSRQYERFSSDFKRLEAKREQEANLVPPGRRTPPQKSPAIEAKEQADRDNARYTLETGKKDLDITRAQIKEYEAKVAEFSKG
jgi:hypothetical protein